MRQRITPLARGAVLALVFIVGNATGAAAAAAPPAEASANASTAVTRLPASSNSYQLIAPGLLARTLFATDKAGPVGVVIVDLLVGPGQRAQLRAAGFAALINVEAGDAIVSLGGKPVAAERNHAIGVDQGQAIEFDNRRGSRPFLARLTELGSAENKP